VRVTDDDPAPADLPQPAAAVGDETAHGTMAIAPRGVTGNLLVPSSDAAVLINERLAGDVAAVFAVDKGSVFLCGDGRFVWGRGCGHHPCRALSMLVLECSVWSGASGASGVSATGVLIN
jgi:hypothetical protein